jgi:hypothetical protein
MQTTSSSLPVLETQHLKGYGRRVLVMEFLVTFSFQCLSLALLIFIKQYPFSRKKINSIFLSVKGSVFFFHFEK